MILRIKICISLLFCGFSSFALEKKPADKKTFDGLVKPFLNKYCTSCHGAKKKKGDIQLHQINYNLSSSGDLGKWQEVLKQLQFNEMPPENKPQPSPDVKNRVIN